MSVSCFGSSLVTLSCRQKMRLCFLPWSQRMHCAMCRMPTPWITSKRSNSSKTYTRYAFKPAMLPCIAKVIAHQQQEWLSKDMRFAAFALDMQCCCEDERHSKTMQRDNSDPLHCFLHWCVLWDESEQPFYAIPCFCPL